MCLQGWYTRILSNILKLKSLPPWLLLSYKKGLLSNMGAIASTLKGIGKYILIIIIINNTLNKTVSTILHTISLWVCVSMSIWLVWQHEYHPTLIVYCSLVHWENVCVCVETEQWRREEKRERWDREEGLNGEERKRGR